VQGLLLLLVDDTDGSPGKWFWPCFEPLRSTFDRHYWIFLDQPWMGPPDNFDHERESEGYEGMGETSVCLWRPGALGRCATQFSEEYVLLWAPHPAVDSAQLASEFRRAFSDPEESAFIEKHAEIWLIYTDSTCWEIFARDESLLQKVRDHLQASPTVRVYESESEDRGLAYGKANVIGVWRALNGHAD
jgi:hypothetical protein